MGTMDEHEACEAGQTAPIKVAGRTIGDPLAAVIAYLREHSGTVERYDFIAGTSDEVTAELIKATRMPWMASRITAREEAWFIEHARSAPWDLVAPNALLRDADAAQPDGSMTRHRHSGTISGPTGQRASQSPRSARSCT